MRRQFSGCLADAHNEEKSEKRNKKDTASTVLVKEYI